MALNVFLIKDVYKKGRGKVSSPGLWGEYEI
jgi:hypothetical protein